MEELSELSELIELFEVYGKGTAIVQSAVSLVTLIAMWIVYNKAGEGGWKILIPIYNEYIRFKIAGCAKRFWIQFVLGLLSVVFLAVFAAAVIQDNSEMAIISIIAAIVFAIAASIVGITVNFNLATAFGLPGVFGVGLWLLPVIFYAIIAFSGSIQYVLNQKRRIY